MPSIFIRMSTSVVVVPALIAYAIWGLMPRGGSDAAVREIFIMRGMSARDISRILYEEQLIRSPLMFRVGATITGTALGLRPGMYRISSSLAPLAIAHALAEGGGEEIEVVIKEGATLFNIDALLAERGVIRAGELRTLHAETEGGLEGLLFPDTYRFLIGSAPEDIAEKFLENFAAKAPAFIAHREEGWYETLILASILEREVPDFEDRRVVAGVLLKRLRNGWPLQVDAALCYAKEPAPCYPPEALDLQIDSPYNTYIYKGLPPTPIGNPGFAAMRAALEPKESPYWFYLSDQKSGDTIFGKTLEEHALHRARYLR